MSCAWPPRPFRLHPPPVLRPSLSHATPQPGRLPACAGLDFVVASPTRQIPAAVSSSLSYGLVVCLRLLSTPPRGGAVIVGFRPESVCLERTCTSRVMAHLQAHEAGSSDPANSWRVRGTLAHQEDLPRTPVGRGHRDQHLRREPLQARTARPRTVPKAVAPIPAAGAILRFRSLRLRATPTRLRTCFSSAPPE